MLDDFELELQKTFFQEADINLEEAEEVYLQLGENPPEDLLARSFRLAHNLKGSAKAVGFSEVAEILHHLENLLLKMKKKELNVTNAVVNMLLMTNDKLKEFIEILKGNPAEKLENKAIIEEISKITTESGGQAEVQATQENQGAFLFQNDESHTIDGAKKDEIKVPKNNKQKVKKDLTEEIIRIPLSKIEKLQNYIGEIVIVQSIFAEQIKAMQNQSFKNYFRVLNKTTKEVQDIIMNLRLVPIKPVFQKLARTARDTSAMLKKEIQIDFLGEETEIDKIILDEISDPLMHMVRNAIDHGLENNAERKEKNKPLEGHVSVTATHEAGHLIISVKDDGKGLNAKSLYEIATKKGVLKGTENLTDEECYQLIFAPGFSTKVETTEISGRGVGMDVVKTNIEMLNGKINIQTEIDKGTNFIIRIPLSVGIMDAFITEICGEKYIIPVNQVIECLSLNKSNLNHISGNETIIILRNEEITIVDLGLGLFPKKIDKVKDKEKVIIIAQGHGKKIGVIVDKIIAIQSVVTKSIGEEMRCEKGFVGSVILGDGKVVPILDVTELISGKFFQQNLQKNKNSISLKAG
ncbi:chemotaxis protein CheA [Pigmentibacter sp. JX0631]|uniref:chemotaxis protein CheA n=1 Tax=Pigmentibacter sp. JX0631 TaxID=2976982 RepID=UPI00246976B0|nr:chemotaxis protein CheA [Pigmentibacter sp. JX0631]WGL60536.1 chemotaxis protein CheA [Pigmentibacter sp. JX0631]